MYVVACLVLLSFSYSNAQNYSNLEGKVVKVVDGNTFELKTAEDEIFLIKLWGTDSPELAQPFGEDARDFLTKMILKKKIVADIKGKDRKGLRLALVILKGDKSVNEEMIERGLAWAEKRYARNAFSSLQEEAQSERIGLWQHTNPIDPMIFRRQQSMSTAKSR